MATPDQLRLQLGRQLAHGELRTERPSEVESDAEILAVEGDLEAERVVVRDHPPAAVSQDPALGCAATKGVNHLLDIETRLHGEDNSLGAPQVGPGEDHLVDGLHGLARAARTDVGD